MTHSLLYQSGAAPTSPHADDAVMAALSLDRALSVILPDVGERRMLAPLLTAPPPCTDDIRYRQAIMRDFLAAPARLEIWQKLLGRLAELKASADDERRVTTGALARAHEENLFGMAKSRLQLAAMTLRRLLLLLGELDAQLFSVPVGASGLRRLLDRIHAIAASAATTELLTRCAPLCTLSEGADYRFALTLDADGRIADCCYLDRPPCEAPPAAPKKGLFGRRRAVPEETHEAVLDGTAQTLQRRLVGDGLDQAAQALEAIAAALFAEFCPLVRELKFYAAGLRFAAFFAARGLPVVLPALAEDGRIQLTAMYDPFLGATIPNGAAVVPTSLALPADCPGLILCGDNNAGKTVFLRALGCALLLGQAGFPICAEAAVITPVRALRCLFAAAETEEQLGNEAGRFEAEVKGLAEAVEAASPGELLLLNEPFQTTAYAEGAEGLCDILGYLTARGTRWALVTHLTLPRSPDDRALQLRCGPDHRVVQDVDNFTPST